MRKVKRLFAMLLCLVMVLSCAPITGFAAGGNTNVDLFVDKTEVNVGDTFIVTIGVNDLTASSVAFGFDFDTELVYVDYVDSFSAYLYYTPNPSRPQNVVPLPLTERSFEDEANRDGHVGFVFASGREYAYDASLSYVYIECTAKAPGTVTFYTFEDSAGTDGYKGEWTHSTTVTIKEAAPACTHANTKAESIGNGAHKIVCTAEGCGVTVNENEACYGGTASCVALAKCSACGAEYGAKGAHVYGDLIPATEAVHTKDELKGAVAAHYFCDVCKVYFTENKEATTLDALTGETPAHTVDPTKTTTKTTKEPTCTEEGTKEVSTFCSCGKLLGTETKPIDKNTDAHSWGDPTYAWNSDHTICQATRVCEREACEGKEIERTNVKINDVSLPTCGAAGETTYTAEFVAKWADTQVWTDYPAATGNHSYVVDTTKGDDGYEWAADYSTCTAYGVCSCGATTSETVDSVFSVKADATCTSAEYRHYTADFTASWAEDQGGDFDDPTGALNRDNHSSDGFMYENNFNGTHKKLHICCQAVVEEAEKCTFDEKHECTVCKGDCAHDDTVKDHICDFGCGKDDIGEHVSNAAHPCLDGKCEYCRADMPATAKHEYDNECDVDCNVCDTDREVGEHKSNATHPCHDGKCVYCGKEMPATADHTYTNECDSDCNTCGDERIVGEHKSNAAHACLDGKCVYCGTDMPATAEHVNVYTKLDNDKHKVTCDVCKEIITASEPHEFKGEDHKCVCGAVELVKISFKLDSNPTGVAIVVPYNTVLTEEHMAALDKVSAPEGYVIEWYDNRGDKVDVGYTATHTDTANGVHVPIEYTLTFTVNGETYGEPVTVKYNEAITAPDYVVPEGHTFSGWDVPDTMPAKDITLDAKLTVNEYTLTFIADHAGDYFPVAESVKVPFGAKIADFLPKAEKIKSFYVNDGEEVGVYNFNGGWQFDAGDVYDWVDDDMTMPATDFNVFPDYAFTGWYSAFDDENNALLGWYYLDPDAEDEYSGWTLISEADYTEDGTGSAWYYLDPVTGYRAEGLKRVPYPTKPINGVTYAANAEDVAYAESKGKTFINAESAVFCFGNDGKFQSELTGIVDNSYAVKGMIDWHVGLVKVEDNYYYFLGNEAAGMNVIQTGDVYVTRNTTEREVHIGGIYTFADDGKLIENNGIVDMPNGTKRYYEDAELMVGNGLTKVGENYIYVRTNGELVVNAEYYVPANSLSIVSGMYMFDENGFMVNPVPSTKNGVYSENGVWFYYEDGVKAYNKGLILFEGCWYDAEGKMVQEDMCWIYVRSNGALATGAYYVTTVNDPDAPVAAGKKCQFNELGVMLEDKNGIVAENNSLYYYENNVLAYNKGVIEIDGNYYYVKSNGEVVNNREYWITNVGESGVVAKAYTFDANGVMLNPEFKSQQANGIVDGYYYVDGKIAYCAGLIELEDENGKFYIYVRSNGQLATGKYWPTNTNGIDVKGSLDFGTDGKYYF